MPTLHFAYGSRLASALQRDVLSRFLRYARIDTQSRRGSTAQPSTAKHLDLCRTLIDELHELGVEDAELTDAGHVLATLDANVRPERRASGF